MIHTEKADILPRLQKCIPFPKADFLWILQESKGLGLLRLRKTPAPPFSEVFERLPACKFHNCIHDKEPGCAVLDAIEQGEIAASRHKNYIEMLKEFDGGPYRDSVYR